jgi:L-seryl-tRNA(Ser) seleniumtransferase
LKDEPDKQSLLSRLPSVDEILKGAAAGAWLSDLPRAIVVQAVREVLSEKRREILETLSADLSEEELSSKIKERIGTLSAFSLVPVINATGIVLHTNLGRAVLSERALQNVLAVGRGFSTLEYDLEAGKRGKRHSHTKRLLRQLTGAEDAFIVNNNAAAVFLCLNTLARDREVIVSRGELVEIGGSFRVPDVMAASGARLKEVGTTNKTHLHDYTRVIQENTGLILKVHQSNYRITGFVQDVKIEALVALGRKHHVPVMYDLGSGCLVDLKPYGIHSEPSVQEVLASGVDIVTFSGDKLLGGPQGGIIAGSKRHIELIQKNPLARAVRVDKLTIAAFEATLMEYLDIATAITKVPVLSMLFQSPDEIRKRARKIAALLRKTGPNADIRLIEDFSQAGGGSLPGKEFRTFAVAISPEGMSVNDLEGRLRHGSPPVIARIKGDALLLDARTIGEQDIPALAEAVSSVLPKD